MTKKQLPPPPFSLSFFLSLSLFIPLWAEGSLRSDAAQEKERQREKEMEGGRERERERETLAYKLRGRNCHGRHI